MGHSCPTLLWDTLVGHCCGTLFVGHSRRTLLGHSYVTPLWDTIVGHSCRILLWDTSSLRNERFVRDPSKSTKCFAATKSTRRGSPSAAPATKSAPSAAPARKSANEPHTTSDHQTRKCAQRHNESAVVRSTRPEHPDFVSLRSRNECTVNSNELAGHARALQRSEHQLPFPYRKNP